MFPGKSKNLESCDVKIHVWSSNIQKGGWGWYVNWTALEQRCCNVDLRCGIQKGGGGGTNVLWTALEERCCDGEDVVMLRSAAEDVANFEDVVTCWRCVYVEDVEDVAMLTKGMHISPMVLWGIMTFFWDPWKRWNSINTHWNSINTQFYCSTKST